MAASARSLYWVEPAAITRLLEQIDGPVAGAARPASAVTSGATETLLAHPVSSRSAALVLPRRPFEARLAALLHWLADVVDYREAFVIDGDGLALAEERTSAERVAAAAALGRTLDALQRTGELAAGTSVVLELAASLRLHLFVATTSWGLLQLGFLTRRLLPREVLDAVREGFSRTLDEKEHDRS